MAEYVQINILDMRKVWERMNVAKSSPLLYVH